MQEKTGNVTLTYEDGADRLEQIPFEDRQIHSLVKEGYDCRRGCEQSWPVLYHLSHLRANLTEWLPVGKEDTLLEFGSDSGQLTGGFLKKAGHVVCVDKSVSRSRILSERYRDAENLEVHAGDPWKCLEDLGRRYDWVIACGLLAEAERYFDGDAPEQQALQKILSYVKPGGHLVLAADNRFGLKYWAGAAEPHTGRYFDSLEGAGHTFSRNRLEQILEAAGCGPYRFYYPYPERWFPMSLYSDRWLPKTGELNQNLRNFEGERLVLFEEEKVYDQLIADGRFPDFSNAFLIIVGEDRRDLPDYVKYSNDRAERFMIRTEIVQDHGSSLVCKVPAHPEAAEHVREMKRWEQELEQLYQKNGVHANRCELRGGKACFEFLRGKTLEEELDILRARKDYAGLQTELQEYKKLLTDTLGPELKPFAKSDLFVEMFGNPEFTKAYRGAPVNNLDWIFGNLMKTADGIWIIDYEWTFPVQVPIEYLIWRAISLYQYGRNDLASLGLMTQTGISPEEERQFEEMEHHFQRWLLGGTVTIGEQYLATAGRTLRLETLLRTDRSNQIQVYADTGNGFSEADSMWILTQPDKQGVIHLEIPLPQGTKALRLDPAEGCSLVKVRRLAGELGGSYELEYIHNGRELEAQGILYTTDDPQITVTNLVEGTRLIHAELSVEHMNPDTAYACMNLLNRVRAAERISQSGPYRILKKIKRALGR